MLAPLLRLSRPTLRESNALAQSPCVKEPRNADTNGEVRRAWMARIRERQLRVQNRPERCGHEVCGGLNRRSSMCLTPLESGMPTRPKGDAHWQREGNETAWIRDWPKGEPSVLSWRIAWALTYPRTPSNAGTERRGRPSAFALATDVTRPRSLP